MIALLLGFPWFPPPNSANIGDVGGFDPHKKREFTKSQGSKVSLSGSGYPLTLVPLYLGCLKMGYQILWLKTSCSLVQSPKTWRYPPFSDKATYQQILDNLVMSASNIIILYQLYLFIVIYIPINAWYMIAINGDINNGI